MSRSQANPRRDDRAPGRGSAPQPGRTGRHTFSEKPTQLVEVHSLIAAACTLNDALPRFEADQLAHEREPVTAADDLQLDLYPGA
ncbi:MAG TPA: hypothetical protein VGJ53_03050, partial [Micromonosporaceae bacterium]